MSQMKNKDIDRENRIKALEILVDCNQQELVLMKKRFDNLWEIFQDHAQADSKFKAELLELVSKL